MSTIIKHKEFTNHKVYKTEVAGRPLTLDVGTVAALATAFAVRRRARERICRPMSVAMVTNTSEATVAVMMTVGSSTSITIGEPESPPVCG